MAQTTTINFECEGVKYSADLRITEDPTPRFIRLTKQVEYFAGKGEDMTEDEGVDAILAVSDYLTFFGIDAEDMPTDQLFAVFAALFDAMEQQQGVGPGKSSGSQKPSKSTAKKSSTS